MVLVFRSFAAAKSCHERFQERQPNGAHSFHALFLDLLMRCLLKECPQAHFQNFSLWGIFHSRYVRCLSYAGDCRFEPEDTSSEPRTTFLELYRLFLIWKRIQRGVFWGQEKHGHAVNTQGACSQLCCGESPRALGQKVPLGDRKTLTLELTAKHMWSCGSGVSVLCSSKVMP